MQDEINCLVSVHCGRSRDHQCNKLYEVGSGGVCTRGNHQKWPKERKVVEAVVGEGQRKERRKHRTREEEVGKFCPDSAMYGTQR